MSRDTISEWESVLTVHDYYDGPRSGISEYRGLPHAYKCEWDDAADDWSAIFSLSPISDEQLAAVTEDWSIWRRYQALLHAGLLQHDDKHPALAIDWPRHELLRRLVEEALKINEANAVRAMPEFRGSIEPTHDFEVRWLPLTE